MTDKQMKHLETVLTHTMQEFMHYHQLPVAGVDLKLYSSPTSFTVVIDSEIKND